MAYGRMRLHGGKRHEKSRRILRPDSRPGAQVSTQEETTAEKEPAAILQKEPAADPNAQYRYRTLNDFTSEHWWKRLSEQERCECIKAYQEEGHASPNIRYDPEPERKKDHSRQSTISDGGNP